MMTSLNMDFTEKKVIDSFQSLKNLDNVILEDEGHPDGRKTSIIKVREGNIFISMKENSSKEILIFSGELKNEDTEEVFGLGSYMRIPRGVSVKLKALKETHLFIKENSGVIDSEQLLIKSFSNQWFPGHGNLKVMPLHQLPHDTAALVFWPSGTKFSPHRHWGGEEIFVMSGEFIDEHGHYPAGTWLRSPHLSSHFPYVEKDTMIMVKTGHLI